MTLLGQSDYRVSKKKAQIGKDTLMCLGFEITQGHRRLGNEQKDMICRMPEPRGTKQLQAFLGMVGSRHM